MFRIIRELNTINIIKTNVLKQTYYNNIYKKT